MIVKMKKVQAVVRESDRERMLNALQQAGVMHIVPVNPVEAGVEADVAARLESAKRSVQVLGGIEPTGPKPPLLAQDASDEVQTIQRKLAEYESHLSSLYRQLEQQAIWGNMTLEDIEVLESAGAMPEFYLIPPGLIDSVKAEACTVVGIFDQKRNIIAVLDRTGEKQIPQEAERLPLPPNDNPSIQAQAAEIANERKEAAERLAELANLLPEMQSLVRELEEKAQYSFAANSALDAEELFAIQGWVPADHTESLPHNLATQGVIAGIRELEPEEEETPPTLIKYPRWAEPIKGLFDILNTSPGYREIDLSAFFMIAMPIFAAMLAGDAAYGLIFLIPSLVFYRRIKAKIGPQSTQLLIIFGAVTFVWGLLSANFFGIKPDSLAEMMPLERESDEATQWLLIKISFIIGSVHLIAAHIRKAMALWPDSRAIADIGWSLALAGMLGVIWYMVFDGCPVPSMIWLIGLAVGLGLAITFTSPNRNPLKRIGIGFASSLLPLISTFSDTMSYIRLMAVGMASYYIAYAFNDLGSTVAGAGTWAAAAPILVFGHALNIILILIAIFAHGVRLNMLEFSNNAGVEWAGYPYNPFSKVKS